jgi:hypothetical protein
MEKYRNVRQRVQDHLADVQARDAKHLKNRKVSLSLTMLVGLILGLATLGIIALQGSFTAIASISVLIACIASLLLAHAFGYGILRSMLIYPLLTIGTILNLWRYEQIRCDWAILFAVILFSLIGMSVSYFLGWVRSLPE